MKRTQVVESLKSKKFDVVIIGGGIFGACAAREAAARGLTVSLIEKNDFSSGSSSQHFKMIHGGIRYLQHGDLYRVRESISARRFFFRTIPHLVNPLPFVIPTYKGGTSRLMLGLGVYVYDLLSLDRNLGVINKAKKIPGGQILSRKKLIKLFPDVNKKNLTGGVLFYDGQMYNSSRVVVTFLRQAELDGASVCNYLKASKILEDNDGKVLGVEAFDELSGDSFIIKAKTILNASGSWAPWLLKDSFGESKGLNTNFSRDACFLINKKLSSTYAIAVLGKTKDPDALISRGARHLFIVPWRNYSLVGVWHSVKKERPEDITITRAEIESFIDEVNSGYEGLNITYGDVTISNWGLTLFGENKDGAENLSYGKRSILLDHAKSDGPEGLISLVGVRATTAGTMAVKSINLVEKYLAKKTQPVYDSQVCWGGEDFCNKDILSDIKLEMANEEQVLNTLYRNYGAKSVDVLKYAKQNPDLHVVIDNTHVLAAEVVYSILDEMAVTLSDVVLRRTEIGSGGLPTEKALFQCANIMEKYLNWGDGVINLEINSLKNMYPNIQQ